MTSDSESDTVTAAESRVTAASAGGAKVARQLWPGETAWSLVLLRRLKQRLLGVRGAAPARDDLNTAASDQVAVAARRNTVAEAASQWYHGVDVTQPR